MRFQVLIAARYEDFWIVAPRSLVEDHWCFSGVCCLNHQSTLIFLMMKTESTSKSPVNFEPDYTAQQLTETVPLLPELKEGVLHAIQ
jgi:hypothetical protein